MSLTNITTFSASALAALTISEIKSLTSTQLSSLVASQLGELTATQVSILPVEFLLPEALTGIATSSINGITIKNLMSDQIAALTVNQIGAFTAKKIANFSPEQLPYFTISQIAAIDVSALDSEQVSALSATQLAALGNNFSMLNSQAFEGLNAGNLAGLSTSQLNALPSEKIAALKPSQLNALSSSQFSNLSSGALSAIAPETVKAIESSISETSYLTPIQLAALTPAKISSFTPLQLSTLTATQAAALKPAQIAVLSAEKVGALSTVAIAALKPQVIKSMDLSALDSDDVAALSDRLIAYLKNDTLSPEAKAVYDTRVSSNATPTGAVTISGSSTQGQTLTADTSSLADLDGLGTFAYQWKKTIGGVTSDINVPTTQSSLPLTQAEVGAQISVTVSYTDGGGTVETVSSTSTSAVLNVNDAPIGNVTISGTPAVGQTLTVSNDLTDIDVLGEISYQWEADGTAISNATNSTYTLTQSELNKVITVTASYNDGSGTAESVISNVTSLVTVYNAMTGNYYTLSTSTTWQDAENQAVALGGHLVTVNDATEDVWLTTTFGSNPMWIGLNDLTTDDIFAWISSEPVTYTNWADDEPSDNSGEHFTMNNWYGGWNDGDTNTDFQGIIEISGINIDEDTVKIFQLSDFGSNPENALTSVTITSLPTLGSLKRNGLAVTVNTVITLADLSNGELTYTPPANGINYAQIGYTLTDSGNLTTMGTLSLNVMPVNDAPVVIPNLLTNGDAELGDLTGWTVVSGGSPWVSLGSNHWEWANQHSGNYGFLGSYSAGSLTQEVDLIAKGYSATYLDSAPTLNFGVYVLGCGNGSFADSYRIKVNLLDANHTVISSASYDSNTLTATNTWELKQSTFSNYGVGARYVSMQLLSVSDAGGWAGNYGVRFDDAFITSASKPLTLDEGTTKTFELSDFGLDVDGNLANVTITNLPVAGSLKLNGSDVIIDTNNIIPIAQISQLTYTPPTDANGVNYATIGYTLTDTENSTASGTLVLNVTPVEDEATGTLTISGTPEIGSTLSIDASGITDPDGEIVETHYQWVLGENPVGTDSATYTPTAGGWLWIEVTTTDAFGGTTTITSDAVDVVLPPPITDAILNPATGNYYLLSTLATWHGAETQAQAMGGHLVTINDAAENAWLVSTFDTEGLWIGLTDEVTEGTFVWTDGSSSSYRNWNSPPDDYTAGDTTLGQDYVYMNAGNVGKWDDETTNGSDSTASNLRGIIEIVGTV